MMKYAYLNDYLNKFGGSMEVYRMKISRRHILFSLFILFMAFFLSVYKLPYYIYKPGHTSVLHDMVTVEDRYDSSGKIQLVTVSGVQATPMDYIWSKALKYHDLVPIGEARPEGISDEEYMYGQLHLMESSQHASTVVAYEAAGKDINIKLNGIRVMSVVKDMPAYDVVQIGDLIVRVDDEDIKEASELISLVETKKSGEVIDLEIIRDDETIHKQLELTSFPDDPNRIGIGIQLVTDQEIDVDPPLQFDSGNIGGPSAGLMFSLEIYNQLTESDITKGYNIVGTGEVDFDGKVLRIGGIDKKIVAAHKRGCDIFFAPHENGATDSNYVVAKQIAEQIKTDMKIVPVDHFNDALDYLKDLK